MKGRSEMLLSTAIALGRHLIDKPDGYSYCKCAIGMGLAAIGREFHQSGRDSSGLSAKNYALQEWPWLKTREVPTIQRDGKTCPGVQAITRAFFAVERGEYTLDQLIDWVKSIEPEEEVSEQPSEQPADSLAECGAATGER
jgi:hypothetical protein